MLGVIAGSGTLAILSRMVPYLTVTGELFTAASLGVFLASPLVWIMIGVIVIYIFTQAITSIYTLIENRLY